MDSPLEEKVPAGPRILYEVENRECGKEETPLRGWREGALI